MSTFLQYTATPRRWSSQSRAWVGGLSTMASSISDTHVANSCWSAAA